MRKLLLTILLTTAAIPALAADLPAKSPRQAPVAVADWTGFYVGIHGGYGWGKTSVDNSDLNTFFDESGLFINDLAFGNPKPKGWVFGGHAGYNWQLRNWVVGVEGDYSAADIKDDQSRRATDVTRDGDILTRTLTSKVDQLATLRARLGILIVPDLLLYGTAGAARGHTKIRGREDLDLSVPFEQPGHHHTYDFRSDTNHFGWVAGAGGEWRLGSNLFLRVEYLHYDFGRTTHSVRVQEVDATHCPVCAPFAANADAKLSVDVVRGGLSLKF